MSILDFKPLCKPHERYTLKISEVCRIYSQDN